MRLFLNLKMNSITEHKLSRRVKYLEDRDLVIPGAFSIMGLHSPLRMNPAMEQQLLFARSNTG